MSEQIDATDLYGRLEDYKPAELYSPTPEESATVSKFNESFEESRKYRLAWERQWELSRLYLKGQQLVIKNRTTGEVFRLPQDDSHRQISVYNVLRPVARTLLGKLTRTIPAWTVIPPTSDLNDIRGSETGKSLLQYITRKEQVDKKYIDLYRHVILSGTSVAKLSWNKDKGRSVAVCDECGFHSYEYEGKPEHSTREDTNDKNYDCPQCAVKEKQRFAANQETFGLYSDSLREIPESRPEGSDGEIGQAASAGIEEENVVSEIPILSEPEQRKIPQLREMMEGDVELDIIDYRDFFVDQSSTSLEEAQWVCHRVAIPVADARLRFPDKAKYITNDPGMYSEQHVSIIQNVANMRSDVRQVDDHVFLYEYHEKPTGDYPKGRVVWIANDMLLEEIENPYEELGRFPFFTFFWEKNVGEFWGESWIEQAWTLQRELNILVTQLREHRELTMRPKLFIPMGSNMNGEEYDTTPGQIFHINPMHGKPTFGEIPPFANYVPSELERLERQIQTQASVSEQDVGVSGSETSGRYAAIMEAQAAQQVGPILRYNRAEWKELGRAILTLCQLFYTDERTWTITGSDRPVTYAFGELNLNPGWDIDIQEDDSLSTNHAVRFNQALSMHTAGLLVDQQTGMPDLKAFATLSGVKLPGIGPDMRNSDHAKAAAIPEQVRRGIIREPKPWDSPDAFAEELLSWLKGPGETEEDQELVQKVAMLWQQYAQASQAALQQEQQAAIAGGEAQPTISGGEAFNASALPDAAEGIQQADQAAAAAAQGGQPQEG
jgi:hypothetical protein